MLGGGGGALICILISMVQEWTDAGGGSGALFYLSISMVQEYRQMVGEVVGL